HNGSLRDGRYGRPGLFGNSEAVTAGQWPAFAAIARGTSAHRPRTSAPLAVCRIRKSDPAPVSSRTGVLARDHIRELQFVLTSERDRHYFIFFCWPCRQRAESFC